MKNYDFITLRASGHQFFDCEEVELLLDWFVVCTAYSDNLRDETNLIAMESILKRRHEPTQIARRQDHNDEWVLLVDPDADLILQHAAFLNETIENGDHLDENLYSKAIDDAIDSLWEGLNTPERIDMFGALSIEPVDLWGDSCPDDLRPQFEAMIL